MELNALYVITTPQFLITTPQFYCGLNFRLDTRETVRHSFLRWVGDTFKSSPCYPEINLSIKMPCGNDVFYKTIDDLPEVDTPCTCGNPDHWIIKIERIQT